MTNSDKKSRISKLGKKMITMEPGQLSSYTVFTLGDNKIDFAKLLSAKFEQNEASLEFIALTRMRACATMLIPYFKRRRDISEFQLKVLYSKLYGDVQHDLQKEQKRVTDKVIESEILQNDEYTKLMLRKIEFDTRVDILYGVVYQVDARRQDMRFLAGDRGGLVEH